MAIPVIFLLLLGAILFYIVVQCGIYISQGVRQKKTKKILTGVIALLVFGFAIFLFYEMSKDLLLKYDLFGVNPRKDL
jgi:hypothetical protein